MGGTLPDLGSLIGGRYEVLSTLKAGGMGAVFVAQRGETRLAVKFPTTDPVDRALMDRFTREANVLARIDDPHVVKVVETGETEEGLPYIVMEYLEGRDLAGELAVRGPLPIAEACDLVIQACQGVAAAHAIGVVHRDLKPGNLFLTRTPNGTVLKVLDFGVSKLNGDGESRTATAEILGTPAYMSPEQLVSSANVDVRTDVWALGIVLYRMLTNTLPFRGDSPVALALAITTKRAASLSEHRAGIPNELEIVLRRALSKEIDQRFPSVTELANALRPFANETDFAKALAPTASAMAAPLPTPPSVDRGLLPLVAIGVVTLGAIGLFFALRAPPNLDPGAPEARVEAAAPSTARAATPRAQTTMTTTTVTAVQSRTTAAAPTTKPVDPSACFARVGYWQSSGPVDARQLSFDGADELATTCYRNALGAAGRSWSGTMPLTLRFTRSGYRGASFPPTGLSGMDACIRSGVTATLTDFPASYRGEVTLTSSITFTCP